MTPGGQAELRARVIAWQREDPDEVTRAELQQLLDRNETAQLSDRFAGRLEFGTAGLRGVIGAGPNRMNRAVVIRTTAGLCAYLRQVVPDAATRGVVIGFDGRRMSRRFAEDVAEVVAGQGLRAQMFADLVPTPLLAFAVTDLGAAAGVMITASHNPPEYNGYKVYWGNGAQIIPPHDAGIATAIDAIGELVTVARPILKEARAKGLVVEVPAATETRYLDAVRALARHPVTASDLVVAYTPLHGVGARLAKSVLERAGFPHVHVVPEQAEPDPNFPTVSFPNPEEKGALDLALALASAKRADLVIANDPDADRLAIACRDTDGTYQLLSGNEVGTLFANYLLCEEPHPPADRLVVTTVVSSPMLGAMAKVLGVRYEETLTGFKWIANRAIEVERETGASFVFGYEEALGYTVGTVTRDKDGISAAAVFAELAAYYRTERGLSVIAQLEQIYRRFGLYVSAQHNATYKGSEGAARIRKIMDGFRATRPTAVDGLPVTTVSDVQTGERIDTATGTTARLPLPSSNVLAYGLADGSRITVRPSGTEPKIKYYFDVRESIAPEESVAAAKGRARSRMDALMRAFLQMADQYAT